MSSLPTVIDVAIMSSASPGFEHSIYRVSAGHQLTIKFRNSLPEEGVNLSLLISSANDPAIAPVAGKAGLGNIIMSKALYVADPVPTGGRAAFRVDALVAGAYVLQIRERLLRFAAQLIAE